MRLAVRRKIPRAVGVREDGVAVAVSNLLETSGYEPGHQTSEGRRVGVASEGHADLMPSAQDDSIRRRHGARRVALVSVTNTTAVDCAREHPVWSSSFDLGLPFL